MVDHLVAEILKTRLSEVRKCQKISKKFQKIFKYFQVTDLIDFKLNGKVFLVFFYPGVSGRRVWWRFWGEIGMKII